MRRERLLVAIDGMEVGGSQRQIQHLLAGLDRERWEPELAFFRNDSHLAETIRRSGIPVHYLPKRSRFDARFLLAYARLLRRRDYAIVHAYSLTAELWSMLARDLSGRRPVLIASERSFDLHRPAWHWMLKRTVLARSAAVIANSRAGALSTARRTHTAEAKFATVANGVLVPAAMTAIERATLRREIGVPESRMFGLFVGRLVAVKNLPCLMHALAKLPAGERPWIALAGDGPLRESTMRLRDALGLAGDVALLGERRDASRLMQAADCLVLPSHFEGLSNALLEAMAAGCPVIASSVGGTGELVADGSTGLLFPAGDANALAAALSRLSSDPRLATKLAVAARQHVEQHHSHAKLATATSLVYERCLASRNRPAEKPIHGAATHVARHPE